MGIEGISLLSTKEPDGEVEQELYEIDPDPHANKNEYILFAERDLENGSGDKNAKKQQRAVIKHSEDKFQQISYLPLLILEHEGKVSILKGLSKASGDGNLPSGFCCEFNIGEMPYIF